MRRFRTRVARWLAPWLAAEYDERMRGLLDRHIACHERILAEQASVVRRWTDV